MIRTADKEQKGLSAVAVEVMKRHENKYIVDSITCFKLQDRISQFAKLDEYNKRSDFYTISNLYYDTYDNNLVRTSVSKPKYKEKLRLRAYGVPTDKDKVYLEIKKKYIGVVNKRRTSFELPDAYKFLSTGYVEPKEYMNTQVLRELEYFIRLYNPSPKLYFAYDRRAYFGENNLRVTFDTNIRTRRYDLKLENGSYGENLIDDDLWVIEIKVNGVNGAIPLWLTKLFAEYKVYRQSFSKYGVEYQKYLSLEEGKEEKCLIQFSMPQTKLQPSHGKVLLPQLASLF